MRRRTSTATSRPRARRWASATLATVKVDFTPLRASDVEQRPPTVARRPPAEPHRDAVAVPDRPGRRRRAGDRRPRRRSLRPRRSRRPARCRAGADRGARARRQPVGEPELAGSAPHQHAGLRRGDGAGGPGAGRTAGRSTRTLELDRPELYFSPTLDGLRGRRHRRADRAAAARTPRYTGTAGVRMSSFVRRLAFALAFMDYNLIGSGAINQDSQMLWVRNVRDRVEKLAPFLSYDGDPYPVVLDGHVLLGGRRLHVDQSLPVRRGGGQRHPPQRGQRHPARRQLRAQPREGRGRRLRRHRSRCTSSTTPTRSCRRGHRRSRPVHAGERDAGRAARSPALSGGPVPGADERVLEVPARSRGLLRARRGVVGGPGAGRGGPIRRGDGGGHRHGVGHRDGGRRNAAQRAGHRVVERPLRPLLHDVRRQA